MAPDSVDQRLPSGANLASSDAIVVRSSSSGAPPSIGRRSIWFFTDSVPIRYRPSGDTSALPSPTAPGIGEGVSASSDWRTRRIDPSPPMTE